MIILRTEQKPKDLRKFFESYNNFKEYLIRKNYAENVRVLQKGVAGYTTIVIEIEIQSFSKMDQIEKDTEANILGENLSNTYEKHSEDWFMEIPSESIHKIINSEKTS